VWVCALPCPGGRTPLYEPESRLLRRPWDRSGIHEEAHARFTIMVLCSPTSASLEVLRVGALAALAVVRLGVIGPTEGAPVCRTGALGKRLRRSMHSVRFSPSTRERLPDPNGPWRRDCWDYLLFDRSPEGPAEPSLARMVACSDANRTSGQVPHRSGERRDMHAIAVHLWERLA
jgi:hypothetical protein